VGIGTSIAPVRKLDVKGSVNFSVNTSTHETFVFTTGAANDAKLLMQNASAATTVQLQANGASYLNGGNVGIGTSGPTRRLHVSMGGSNITGNVYDAAIFQNSDAVGIRLVDEGDGASNGGNAGIANDNGNLNLSAAKDLYLSTALDPNEALYAGASTGGDTRVRIAENGRQFFYGMDSSSTYGSWAFGHPADGSSNGYLSSWTNVFGHRIHLRTNGNANPSQTGTVSFSGSGSNNFRIMQNVGHNGVYWNASTQAGRGTFYEMDNGSHYWSNTDSVSSGSTYTPATRMWLDTNGNLRTSGSMTANYSFSDQRLKQDVEELPSALDKVKALRTVKFNWIDEEQRREHKELGLIAQEVKEIYPELVHTNEMFPVEDEETLEKIKGEERYSMEYEKLSVVLLKAMQEQQVLIEALQAEVAALKGE